MSFLLQSKNILKTHHPWYLTIVSILAADDATLRFGHWLSANCKVNNGRRRKRKSVCVCVYLRDWSSLKSTTVNAYCLRRRNCVRRACGWQSPERTTCSHQFSFFWWHCCSSHCPPCSHSATWTHTAPAGPLWSCNCCPRNCSALATPLH